MKRHQQLLAREIFPTVISGCQRSGQSTGQTDGLNGLVTFRRFDCPIHHNAGEGPRQVSSNKPEMVHALFVSILASFKSVALFQFNWSLHSCFGFVFPWFSTF
jgi:hypothetical protein